MTANPLVSIIIPTYNRAHLLGKAVHSALAQTYDNLEVVIVDDASSDQTTAVVKEFRDPRVRYYRQEQNQGGAATRNTGIAHSRGEYINFLDDDDQIFPEKVQRQMELFRNSSVKIGAVYCGWQYRYQNAITSKYVPHRRGNVFPAFLVLCFTVTHAPLIRRSVLLETKGFDPALKGCQDWDLWIRLSQLCEIDFVPEILVDITIHEGQISSKLGDKIDARKRIFEKYQVLLQSHPQAFSAHAGRLGALTYLHGNKKEAYELLKTALIKAPWWWKNYAYWLLLLADQLKKGTFEKFVIEKRGNSNLYY